jgi:hypothetical protein
MRLGVVVGLLALGLVVVMAVATGAMSSAVTGTGAVSTQAQKLGCEASVGPFTGSGDGAAKAKDLNREQRANVALIISIGKQRHLDPLAWQIEIQAAMTESGLRNLDHGDRDSLGLFQMRPSQGWGTREQVTNPTYEINKFYDVLLGVSGWQDMTPGRAAQAVERSAFPDRYRRFTAMGATLIKHVGDVSDPTGCGPSAGNSLPAPSAAAQQALDFALNQLGKPYVWGAEGPDAYDCSGLVQTAYESAGVKLDRVANDQFTDGAYLPVRDAQPGDLLFWAFDTSNPVTIHHVALYLGDDKIVEAPQTGVPVRVRKIDWKSTQLMSQAVRPGV